MADCLLSHPAADVQAFADPLNVGTFYRVEPGEPGPRRVVGLGEIEGVQRLVTLHRYEPFWMKAWYGTDPKEVPAETQFLMAELSDGRVAILVPLIDEPVRASLQGGENGLEVVLETGDPATPLSSAVALFSAEGEDLYALVAAGAESVAAELGTTRLRVDKRIPEFVDEFGWCTWDAFYQAVSQEKVRDGLDKWREGGIVPRLLILDDGWQSVVDRGGYEGKRLTSFAANEKFGGDLSETVEIAKGEFGVNTFLVWHAMTGYWGGVDASMPYRSRGVLRRSSPGILAHEPGHDGWWGRSLGLLDPHDAARFFSDYHRALRRQGVDGVKVDVQAQLETVADGTPGGRVGLMRQYREALEGSVQTHFLGNLINCMSCSNDMLYQAPSTTVTRTSTDFWPNIPESHGRHLQVNALVSLWFGEFVLPDWDMFQSAHAAGKFHAIGRAVSGGPVYVSDKPGETDFELLGRLVLPDGTTPRAIHPGLPTRDCAFVDVTLGETLLKIWNENPAGWVLAALNAGTERPLAGGFSIEDLPGADPSMRFVVHAHFSGETSILEPGQSLKLSVAPLDGEVFTVAPIIDGVALVGITDYMNAGGTIRATDGAALSIVGEGRFLAWCETRPEIVLVDGMEADFRYADGKLEIDLEGPEASLMIA